MAIAMTLSQPFQEDLDSRIEIMLDIYRHIRATFQGFGIDVPISHTRHERYDPVKWNDDYPKRFHRLADKCKNLGILNPLDQKELGYESVDAIIECYLFLTPAYAHFRLDPNHLAAHLGTNHGGFRETLFALMERLAANPSKDEATVHTGIQLFHRLVVLEKEWKHGMLVGQEKENTLMVTPKPTSHQERIAERRQRARQLQAEKT